MRGGRVCRTSPVLHQLNHQARSPLLPAHRTEYDQADKKLCLCNLVDGRTSNEVAKTWALMHRSKLNKKSLPLFPVDTKLFLGSVWSEASFAFHSWLVFFLRQLYRPKGNLSCLEPEGKTCQSFKHLGICFRWGDWYNYTRWELKLPSVLILEVSFVWFSHIICKHILPSPKQWVGFLIGFSGNYITIF